MTEEAQDKQNLPTGKRLADLRKRGVVMRSRDLSGGLIFAVGIMLLMFSSTQFLEIFESNFLMSYGNIKSVLSNPDNLGGLIKEIVLQNVKQLIPMFIILLVVAFLSPFLFGGWNFTLDVLNFKLEKLNPISNFKKLLSIKHTSIEIIRSMFKAFFILGVLFVFFIINKNNLVDLTSEPGKMAIHSGAIIIKRFIIILLLSLIVTILFDMVYHYFQFQSKAKMSHFEIKEETRETEGDAQTKRRIRSAQLALIKQKLHQSVPKASVVITNPTHYAVAIKYDRDKDNAPKLLAKGKGHIAAQIRQIAIANAIPIYEAPPLARAIYFTGRLNYEIDPALYMSVAIVLSYVYQLKKYQAGMTDQLPSYVNDLKIPEDFIYHDNE